MKPKPPSAKNSTRHHLASARLKFDQGQYKECLRQCQLFYQRDPSDTGNLLLLSACHFQLKEMQESIFYGQQAIEVDGTLVEALVLVGNGLKELGKLNEAVEIYNKVLRVQPRFAHPYVALGCIQLEQNCHSDAIGCFEVAAQLDPAFRTNLGLALIQFGDKASGKSLLLHQSESSAIACLGLGNLAHEEGDFDAAINHYSQALQIEPSFLDAATSLCGTYIEIFKATRDRNLLHKAASRLEQIISSFKNSQSAYLRLGLCHRLEGRYKQAHRYLLHAIHLDPTNSDALCNLAALHVETGNKEQAARLCLRALEFNPNHAQAFACLGLALFQMGYEQDALKCLSIAKNLKSSADICCSLGSVMNEMGDTLKATKLLRKAIAFQPFDIPAFLNMGNAYFDYGRLDYAERCYRDSIDSKTIHSAVARSNLTLLHLSQRKFDDAANSVNQLRRNLVPNGDEVATLAIVDAFTCEWESRSTDFEHILTGISCGAAIQPFHAQIVPQISPQMALSISNMFSKRFHKQALHCNSNGKYEHEHPKPGNLVRIGYVSSCFGNSVPSLLTHDIFHLHNKEKFQVFCISLSCSDGSSEWEYIQESADVFVDLSEFNNSGDIANAIQDHSIDILVDLDGYCHGAKPDVFTLRPAPVQITMSCGTMGSESGMDYIVGDKYTIPEHDHPHFSEKVMYVPNIVNSYSQDFSLDVDKSKMREQCGIKDDAFVYACFSQPYKISPDLFSVWMEILHEAPDSLLVLLRYSVTMETNLRKEAAKYDIADDRVVFLDLVPRNKHLARFCLADAFLDTFVCSGIATGCDALWSGVPLITIAGDRFCNRVGASLVSSAGLDEFIAANLEEYKALALSLAFSEKEDRIDIVHLLDDARKNSSLFDSKQWVCAFETALEVALGRHRQHLKPDHIPFHPNNDQDLDSQSTDILGMLT